jgi:predicted dehydrogenase
LAAIALSRRKSFMANRVRVAIIGAGLVSDYHHVPGLRLDKRAELVGVCDADAALVARRQQEWDCPLATTDYHEVCSHPDVDAVIIATPNYTHLPIALAAIENRKHVLCEKPLGLSAAEVRQMYHAARDAGIVHMTAFTYRFAPAMRYMKYLVRQGAIGTPRHFRSQRFLDWPETSWGWRQYKKTAGAGDLFDMTIHRVDFAMDLLGPLDQVCGAVKQFVPRDRTRDGQPCPPSEVDDWSSLIGEFRSGAVGVWEGTTLAKGYGLNGFGHEWAEINGSEQTVVYQLHKPNQVLLGRTGRDLTAEPVPEKFLVAPGSPRDPSQGEPATVFRYDVVWEFVSAIVEGRPAEPDFYDGLRAQIVVDAVLRSYAERRWVTIPDEPR